jgi:hypothetical protein
MTHYLEKEMPIPDCIKASEGVFNPTTNTSLFQDESDHLQNLSTFDFEPEDMKVISEHREKPICISKVEKGRGTSPVKITDTGKRSLLKGDDKQEDPERIHLLNQIAERARRKQYQVFSKCLENSQDFPMGWDKPIPDLLIKCKDRTVAYLYVSSNSIKDGTAINRWEEFNRLEGIQIRLAVKSRRMVRPLVRIQKEKGLKGKIIWVSPKKRFNIHHLKEKVTSYHFMVFSFGVILMILVSLLVSGSVPNLFKFASRFERAMRKQAKIYQPRDIERQPHLINQKKHSRTN